MRFFNMKCQSSNLKTTQNTDLRMTASKPPFSSFLSSWRLPHSPGQHPNADLSLPILQDQAQEVFTRNQNLSFNPDCPQLFFSEMCLVLLKLLTTCEFSLASPVTSHIIMSHSGITSGLAFNAPYSLIEINNWKSLYTRSVTFVFSEIGSENSALEERTNSLCPKLIKYVRNVRHVMKGFLQASAHPSLHAV